MQKKKAHRLFYNQLISIYADPRKVIGGKFKLCSDLTQCSSINLAQLRKDGFTV